MKQGKVSDIPNGTSKTNNVHGRWTWFKKILRKFRKVYVFRHSKCVNVENGEHLRNYGHYSLGNRIQYNKELQISSECAQVVDYQQE
jgi:hypothetical protein